MIPPIDEILLQKTSSIRRCVRRAREERTAAGDRFGSDVADRVLESRG